MFYFIIYRHLLHFAAAGGNLLIFNSLLNLPKFNEQVDAYGNTPLHYAAKFGRSAIVQLICDENADIMRKNKNGFLASHFAAMSGSLQSIQALYNRGDPLTKTNRLQWTPLHYAIKYQHFEIVDFLIKVDAVVSTNYDIAATLIQLAVTYGSNNLIQSIIEKSQTYSSLNHNMWNFLHFAAASGNSDILSTVSTLIPIELFSQVDRYQRTLAHLAAINGHLNVIVLLDLLKFQMNSETDQFKVFSSKNS
ncbi:hypothetical protein TRFO_21320 [Tritrichomonas foetus]|uniref:Uncharacterized protein n=1 Tax=Tritrichomonas foetus TaxID=1144522 RepID=A0A1J4KE43_9EUKA|nr:hypothetical protein TRFO_21320 [Tritrichomonas foetus]|eukprot:OHT09697.1 hypothetical protein TRFO_21320 [Tritrichomonas foetus]